MYLVNHLPINDTANKYDEQNIVQLYYLCSFMQALVCNETIYLVDKYIV